MNNKKGFVPAGVFLAVLALALLIGGGMTISTMRMQEGESQLRTVLRGAGCGIIPFALWFIIACLREKEEDNKGCLVLAVILLVLGIAGTLFL